MWCSRHHPATHPCGIAPNYSLELQVHPCPGSNRHALLALDRLTVRIGPADLDAVDVVVIRFERGGDKRAHVAALGGLFTREPDLGVGWNAHLDEGRVGGDHLLPAVVV